MYLLSLLWALGARLLHQRQQQLEGSTDVLFAHLQAQSGQKVQ